MIIVSLPFHHDMLFFKHLKGHFGTVYLGNLHDKKKNCVIKAAVKTLINMPDPSSIKDFHREADIMKV
jgi:serine/threonine protein kinase